MKTPARSSALPRREFLKTSAALAATAALGGSLTRPLTAAERTRSVGANDRIRIGMIGCGDRGYGAHLQRGILPHLATQNFEVVALADPWRLSREKTNALVQEKFGREARAFTSYRDLLALDGIDAVMIASPDHHHTTHLEAAAKAGIPALSVEVGEAARVLDAPAARLLEGGTQRLLQLQEVEALLASGTLVVDACRNVVRAGGAIVPLASRPVLFALARALGEAAPSDISRSALLARAFRARHADESHRARLRVEMGDARKAVHDGGFIASRSIYDRAEHVVKASIVDRINPARTKKGA